MRYDDMRAIKTAFPNLIVNREPLPDIPDDSGFILALVTLEIVERTADRSRTHPDSGDRHRALHAAAERCSLRRPLRSEHRKGSGTSRDRSENDAASNRGAELIIQHT